RGRGGGLDHAARLLHDVPERMTERARLGDRVLAPVERLGGGAVGGVRAAVDLVVLLLETLGGVVAARRRNRPRGEVVRQMYSMGNRSFIFIAVPLGFIGMVSVYQTCLQFQKVTGDFSQVGVQFFRLIVSDLAPTLTALMLATRVGAGIAA